MGKETRTVGRLSSDRGALIGVFDEDKSLKSIAHVPTVSLVEKAQQAEIDRRNDKAMEIAKSAQEMIGEAYRSPFTQMAAYEAAKMALEQMNVEQGDN